MPNRNYIAGRNFEYATMRTWEKSGFKCIRASGSHGEYDVIAYRLHHYPVFLQCKVVTTEAEANRLIKAWKEDTRPSKTYCQFLTIKIKGSTKAIETYI